MITSYNFFKLPDSGGMRWAVIGEIYKSEAYAPIYALIWAIIIAIAILAAVVVTSAIVTGRRIGIPLGLLANAAHLMGRGDFTIVLAHNKNKDEIGKMAEAFIEMKNTTKHLIEQVSTAATHVASSSEELAVGAGDAGRGFAVVAEQVRKLAEAALRESESKYRRLIELANEGIWVDDKHDVITFVNPQMARMLGYAPEEMLGRRATEFMHPDYLIRNDAGELVQNDDIGAQRLRGESSIYEKRFTRSDGTELWCLYSGAPILDDDGQYLGSFGMYTDITERKRSEAAQARLEAQLQQAQKMESVGRLAGGVAHDFNNMLGVILGYTELSLSQVDADQPLYSHLLEVRKAAERSADITRQLLAFARKQTVAPKVLNFNETIADMLVMLERLIGEDTQLSWLPSEELWPVMVDPSQIDQILANLCVNTRDAIAGVGKITIETSNCSFDKAYCSDHASFVPGEYVRLVVSDDGCGMDKEALDMLFEPFFTTKEMGQGTGLGLATVYGAVKQNDGFINVYSEPGVGTTFTIYLPRYVGKSVQVSAAGAAVPALRGHETILLVEDESAILKLTAMMLEKRGYSVLAASTPGAAISLAREHAGEIDLLMTDVIMPEMSGRDLAKNLLSLYPRLKRLFMSGYTADVIAHHGILDEGVRFIQKPFSIDDLAAKVQEALDRE